MARYLVTGGAGFIGSHLVRGLLARGGTHVRVLDDFSSGKRENLAGVGGDLEVVEGSLIDAETVQRAAEGTEGIFHLGALASVPRSVEEPARTTAINIGGTVNVLTAARATSVRRVVFASSSSIYGDSEVLPKVETMTPAPLSPYALQKLAGEHLGKMAKTLYGVEWVSLRFFNVFGERQDPRSEYAAVIPRFIASALRGEAPTIFGDGGQSRDFTYVGNVVNACIAASEASADAVGEAINIACGERITLLELCQEIARVTGKPLVPKHAAPRAGDVRHSLASIDKAKRLLGFTPGVGLREGLERTVAQMSGK